MSSVMLLASIICIVAGQIPDIAGSPAPEVTVEAANTERVRWQGPIISGAAGAIPGTVTFAWPGVKAVFEVEGAQAVSMNVMKTYVADGHKFRVFVDGISHSSAVLSGNTFSDVMLVEGLDPTVAHTITMWYITDPIPMTGNIITDDSIIIRSFGLDAGRFEKAPPQRLRHLQILGDSIVSGNQISPAAECQPDQSLTYVSKLCELYRANCSTTALTGKGVYKNCCDDGVTMPGLYRRAIPGVALSEFEQPHIVPDAVLVNLGTNDYIRWTGEPTGDDFTQFIPSFTESYAQLLEKLTVRAGLPDLPVFCAFGAGPMGGWIHEAILAARSVGAQNIRALNFSQVETDGCVGHPGLVGHEQMFEIVAPLFQAVLGWSPGDPTQAAVELYPPQLWIAREYHQQGSAAKNYGSSAIAIALVMLFTISALAAVKFWPRSSRMVYNELDHDTDSQDVEMLSRTFKLAAGTNT